MDTEVSHHIYQFFLHYKENLFQQAAALGLPSSWLTDCWEWALWSRRLLLPSSTPGASSLFGVNRKHPQRQSKMRLGTHQSEEPCSSVDLNKPWTTVYRAAERGSGVSQPHHVLVGSWKNRGKVFQGEGTKYLRGKNYFSKPTLY